MPEKPMPDLKFVDSLGSFPDATQSAYRGLGASAPNQVFGKIGPESRVGQRHQPQVRVDLEHELECGDRRFAVPRIVSDNSSERMTDRRAAGSADQSLGESLEPGNVVLAELESRQSAQSRDIFRPALEDLLVGLDRTLTLVAPYESKSSDMQVVEVELAGTLIIGLGGIRKIERAETPGRQQRGLSTPGTPLEMVECVA